MAYYLQGGDSQPFFAWWTSKKRIGRLGPLNIPIGLLADPRTLIKTITFNYIKLRWTPWHNHLRQWLKPYCIYCHLKISTTYGASDYHFRPTRVPPLFEDLKGAANPRKVEILKILSWNVYYKAFFPLDFQVQPTEHSKISSRDSKPRRILTRGWCA